MTNSPNGEFFVNLRDKIGLFLLDGERSNEECRELLWYIHDLIDKCVKQDELNFGEITEAVKATGMFNLLNEKISSLKLEISSLKGRIQLLNEFKVDDMLKYSREIDIIKRAKGEK